MIIKCNHWKDCKVTKGGCCEIEAYHRPSYGTCLFACESNTHKPSKEKAEKLLGINHSKGLGDTVKKIIDKVTRKKIKPCGGCKKRQEMLNKIMPYNKNSEENGELNG